jgi:hypothetical protein
VQNQENGGEHTPGVGEKRPRDDEDDSQTEDGQTQARYSPNAAAAAAALGGGGLSSLPSNPAQYGMGGQGMQQQQQQGMYQQGGGMQGMGMMQEGGPTQAIPGQDALYIGDLQWVRDPNYHCSGYNEETDGTFSAGSGRTTRTSGRSPSASASRSTTSTSRSPSTK